VVRTIECLRHEGRLEEAMIFASDEMPYWEQSADFYFVVGCLLLDQMQKHPEQGESLLPMIEESWLKALAIGELVHTGTYALGELIFEEGLGLV